MGDLLGEISTEKAVEMIRGLDEVKGDAAWEEMKQKMLASNEVEATEGGEGEEGEEGEKGAEGEGGAGAEGGVGEGARRRLLGRSKIPHWRHMGDKKLRAIRPAMRGGKDEHRVQSLQAAEGGDQGGEDAAVVGEEEEGDAGNATSTDEDKPLTPREQVLAKFGCVLDLKRLDGFWGQVAYLSAYLLLKAKYVYINACQSAVIHDGTDVVAYIYTHLTLHIQIYTHTVVFYRPDACATQQNDGRRTNDRRQLHAAQHYSGVGDSGLCRPRGD